MKSLFSILFLSILFFISSCTYTLDTFSIADYGISSNTRENVSAAAYRLINDLQNRDDSAHINVIFPKGIYHFMKIVRLYVNITFQIMIKLILKKWDWH